MNEPAGVAAHVGAMVPPMAARTHDPIQPAWEPSSRRLSKTDSIRAGAFLMFYLAVYMAAGYAAITLIEWAWIRIFS